jgi:hypothetical protein
MPRSARRIAPQLTACGLARPLSSLLVGAAFVGVAGCGDENDPATHVKKLDDPATRVQAVSRIIQFYEDKSTADKHDKGVACTSDNETVVCQSRSCGEDKTCKLQVKPLLDVVVEPMTQRCVAGDLDERTNSKLIKFLADTRDPKAEPCLIKTLKDYKPEANDEDVRNVCRAVGAMKLKTASQPLIDVFTKVHASKPKAQSTGVYRDVHDAMVALEDPAWEGQLVTYLGRPLPADPKDTAGITDEMYWQITAAELVGHLKSASAVKPLLKVMLTPTKAAAQGDAVLSLVKIGKPAVGPTVALLRGEDKDLVEFSKTEAVKGAADPKEAAKGAGTAYVGGAALVLATIGREETGAPLVEALGKETNDLAKAIMTRELYKVPRTPQTIKAFQDAYEKIPVTLSIPNSRGGAREVLLDVAPNFYDASFVPWMAKSVKDMKGKGSDDDLNPIRAKALEATLKLATKDQLSYVDELASLKSGDGTLGKEYKKEIDFTKSLLGECSDKVDCYLKKLTDPNVNTDDKQYLGIKSTYMLGELGGADIRTKIMAVYPKISHPAIKFAALSVVDATSPKGDPAIAGQLQKIVDDANATKDTDKMRFNGTLKQFIYRLNARAQ